MSGMIRGKIECRSSISMASTNRLANEMFKALWDFFNWHPNYTLVAYNTGVGGSAGSTDYWDGANPFQNNAWFCVRATPTLVRPFPFYVLIQLANVATYIDTVGLPSAPCLISGNDYNAYSRIAIQTAIGIGGDEDPWKGTSGLPWQNTKGSPAVWGIPSGGGGGTQVLVFDRSNDPGGTYDATKKNMTKLLDWSNVTTTTQTMRYGVVADDDNIFIFFSPNDDLNYYVYTFTMFTARPGLTLTYPMVSLFKADQNAITAGTTYGTTGGDNTGHGGCPCRDYAGRSIRGVLPDAPGVMPSVQHQPNVQFAVPEFDILPVILLMNENPDYGCIGQVDAMRLAFNVMSTTLTDDKKWIMLGNNTRSYTKNVIPWDGVTVPRSGITRAGSTFSRAP